jgi:hypothetical protein
LLTEEQEDVLVDWVSHHAATGLPLSKRDLCNEAFQISGKPVSMKWVEHFEKCHPQLQSMKPSRLDPKRAKNFNKTVISNYFDKLEELHSRYDGIPPEHIWNMDEKGIQLGGGRGQDTKKYYFPISQPQKYWVQCDNLENVTILECVSAAGAITPPSFCLQGVKAPDLRDVSDDSWGRYGWIGHHFEH